MTNESLLTAARFASEYTMRMKHDNLGPSEAAAFVFHETRALSDKELRLAIAVLAIFAMACDEATIQRFMLEVEAASQEEE